MGYRMRVPALLLVAAAALWSTTALAWPDDRSVTKSVYSDTMSVRMANGSIAKARVNIKITATLSIQEDGNANWPDNRSCHFRNVRRTLVRELTLTAADGTAIPVRDTVISLSPGNEKHWGEVTPCNDKAGEAEAFLDGEIGPASNWQSYIDGQNADARRIIEQFGQVI